MDFSFGKKKPLRKPILPKSKITYHHDVHDKPVKRPGRIPAHFQKNQIITYSQREINQELRKYPGLLKTLAHAYQYELIFVAQDNNKEYWFCRDLQVALPLLKYLNEQGWRVDWQEKPFFV